MTDIHFRGWLFKEHRFYYPAFQKLSHVLLCRVAANSDHNNDRLIPVKRVGYDEVALMQGAGIKDLHGNEIFEGDCLEFYEEGTLENQGTLEEIPDMYKSRGLHPLECFKAGLSKPIENYEIRISGNIYEDA